LKSLIHEKYHLVAVKSSSIPLAHAQLVAWYVDIISFNILYFLCIGYKTTAAIAVVQFGFAISLLSPITLEFISGTTNGTSSIYLKAEELSITIDQEFIAYFAKLLLISEPAENKAKSTHSKDSFLSSSTIKPPKAVSIFLPAECHEAKSFN
jgi:hypothetical protein